jgi:hypothetical protein
MFLNWYIIFIINQGPKKNFTVESQENFGSIFSFMVYQGLDTE